MRFSSAAHKITVVCGEAYPDPLAQPSATARIEREHDRIRVQFACERLDRERPVLFANDLNPGLAERVPHAHRG